MIVSHKWLQIYFDKKLPSPEKLEEVLTLGAFEVEDMEKVGDDNILDIDVLPNRAHDCLSHRGIAKELSVLLGTDLKPVKVGPLQVCKGPTFTGLGVEVEEAGLCRRYIGRKIEGVEVGPSPDWLCERLETIGQKSINNIVDATNYVMFDVGQPLHAFDADKIEGGIVVRKAKSGEKIITLSGDEVELDESVLVIADEKEPLAIAGVKGGKKAEVDENTTNIILEAANFAPVNVRKTSRKLNILTDSSKRFENEISPEMAGRGMEEVSVIVVDVASSGNTKVGDVVDVYPKKANPYKVGVSLDEINRTLGTQITKNEVEDIWRRFSFDVEVVAPVEKIKKVVGSDVILDKEYKSGASVTYDAPEIFDCSSLSAWIFKEAGIAIPRMSVDQFVFSEKVEKDNLRFGDLVFSNTGIVLKTGIYNESIEFLPGTKVPHGVDHLGIYIGDGKVLHTSSQTRKAVLERLEDAPMFKNIVGYGRINGIDAERFVVTIPSERLDLRIKEDLIEEVGRVYGYRNIKPEMVEKSADAPVNKTFYYVNKVRNILVKEGFSEVYTSSFSDNGKVEVENPMAEDKKFLRDNLHNGLIKSRELNIKYIELLGVDKIKIFEVGKIFKNGGEELHLSVGVGHVKSKKGESAAKDLEEILSVIFDKLGIKMDIKKEDGTTEAEINLDELIEKLPYPKSYDDVFETYIGDVKYQKISPYPFIGRDIAVFVPEGVEEEEIKDVIRSEGSEPARLNGRSGGLLVRGPKLFDRFEKKDKETGKIEKVSYAFKMVFQSQEKTLTDEEVNEITNRITKALNSKEGWEVR
jgi:phenylalanyl-tRNA synthetase beta subunit